MIDGTGATSGLSNPGILVSGTSFVSDVNGDITLAADTVDVASTSVINAGTNYVKPFRCRQSFEHER